MIRTIRLSIWLSYWVMLLTLTHLPKSRMIKIPGTWIDDIVHGLAYTMLSVLTVWALAITHRRGYWVWAVVLLVYAAADEWTQGYFDRTPSISDWLADGMGIAAGLTLCCVVAASRSRA